MLLIRLAEAGRWTQAMKRVRVRGGGSSEGEAVPEVDGESDLEFSRSEREESIPERIPIPRVPSYN